MEEANHLIGYDVNTRGLWGSPKINEKRLIELLDIILLTENETFGVEEWRVADSPCKDFLPSRYSKKID